MASHGETAAAAVRVVIGSRIVGIVFGAAAGVRYNKLSVTRMCPGVAAALSGSGGCWLVMVDDFAPSLVLPSCTTDPVQLSSFRCSFLICWPDYYYPSTIRWEIRK